LRLFFSSTSVVRMLALFAGSSGFTLAPTAVPRRHGRVAAANVVMQSMADLRFFQRFDTDQSQSIDKEEFLAMQSPAVLAKFSKETIVSWFDAADINGNGLLEADEFFAMNGLKVTAKGLTVTGSGRVKRVPKSIFRPTTADPDATRDSDESVVKAPTMDDMRKFNAMDTDGNATLDFQEFIAMQTPNVSKAFSVEEMRAVFDKVDEDGTGTLDLNEFMQASSLLAVVAK